MEGRPSEGQALAQSLAEAATRRDRSRNVRTLRRLYGEDFVVDEALWHGRVENGRPFLMDGRSGKVSFRLLHVFELRGGKIAAEQVWCDLAALQRQLGEAQ